MNRKSFSFGTPPLLAIIIGLILISRTLICPASDTALIEDLCGVSWVGTDYNVDFGEGLMVVKWIYYPNGKCEAFFDIHSKKPAWNDTFTIVESWIDFEGNSWYKVKFKLHWSNVVTNYALFRLNNTKTILEHSYSDIDYPTEIDPNSDRYSYRIY